jgi:hypothetical protein
MGSLRHCESCGGCSGEVGALNKRLSKCPGNGAFTLMLRFGGGRRMARISQCQNRSRRQRQP